LFTVFGENE